MKAILRLLLLSCTLGPTSACAQTHTRAAGTPAPQAPIAPRVLGSGFQVGDRILLKVEGDSQFSDPFTVGPGPGLTLPVIGEIPLVGVRRADVEPYMSRELARYLKDPVVRAKALIRVSVVGEVQRPGFYSLPGDAVLADARSEEHTSELQSRPHLVCRLLLEKQKIISYHSLLITHILY